MATQMSKFGMIFEQVTGSAPGHAANELQLYASSSTDETGTTKLYFKDSAGNESEILGSSNSAFSIEDGDGTELAISGGAQLKFVDTDGIDINWTDVSNGIDGDEYDLTFTIDIQNLTAIGDGGTSVADTDTFIVDDGDGGTIRKITRAGIFTGSAIPDGVDFAGDVAISGTLGVQGAMDFNGNAVFVTATFENDVAISGTLGVQGAADLNSTLDVAGVATMAGHLTASAGIEVTDALVPASDDAVDLGRSGAEFKDLYLDGVAYIDDLRADTAKFADLTSGSLVLAGADGALLNDSKLTFDAAAQSGVGVLYVGSMLSVTSSVNFAGGYMANADQGASFDASNGNLYLRALVSADGGVNALGGYGSSGVSISSGGGIQSKVQLQVGADGAGQDVTFFGGAANEALIYDASENHLKVQDSSAANIVTIGGDATTDYAIDVTDGANNINKIRAAAFVTYSDESLKTEVTSMADTALDTIMSLNGVEFTWKDSGVRDFGFIAQEVNAVVPKAVHIANDGIQGVDYSRLTSILVEAVKAQQVQIEDLKKVITNLKK